MCFSVCTCPSPFILPLSLHSVFQIAFRYYRLNIYITEYHILETMLIFILFGWSAIPFIYVLSFLFTGAASAYIKLILLSYFSGTLCVLIDSTVDYSKCKG